MTAPSQQTPGTWLVSVQYAKATPDGRVWLITATRHPGPLWHRRWTASTLGHHPDGEPVYAVGCAHTLTGALRTLLRACTRQPSTVTPARTWT